MSKKNNEFLILGSIIVGLFVLLGITNIDYSEFFVEEAQAQTQYPTYERMDNYEVTMHGEKHGTTRMGLPMHVLDNQGDYVPFLAVEDGLGIQVESGTMSYYFDKNSCAMTMFNNDRINQTSSPVVKGNMWVVKVATNGTDDWSDIYQNTLPCVVNTDINSNSVTINSTKSDSNGIITEIYRYDQYAGLKHDMYFTNNDTNWNDHKFSFSNILQDVPESFSIDIVKEMEQLHIHGTREVFRNATSGDKINFLDLGNGTSAGDVFRTYEKIPVTVNDEIIEATFVFDTLDPEHQTGNGRAILYDQNLNLLATSEEIFIDVNQTSQYAGEVNSELVGHKVYHFPFASNYTVTAGITDIYVGIFFDDNQKVIASACNGFTPNCNGTGTTVQMDTGNTYPTAPDPFSDTLYINDNAIWAEITTYGNNTAVTTEMYSQYSGNDQNYLLGGEAIVLGVETVEFNRTDFIKDGEQITHGFHLYQKTSQPDLHRPPLYVDFDIAFTELWAVKFVSEQDSTLDVYVDYANVNQPLGIGETINIDPTDTFSELGTRTLSMPSGGSTFHCGRTSSSAALVTTLGVTALSLSGGSRSCSGTYAFWDITSIPDDAVPIDMTWSVNVTSGACSGSSCASNIHSRQFIIVDEDLTPLSNPDFALVTTVPTSTSACKGGFACVIDNDVFGSFGNTAIGQIFPSVRGISTSLPTDDPLIQFEAQLESGKNFWQNIYCPSVSSSAADPDRGGCFGSGSIASRSNSIIWEANNNPDTFFEVEWELFTVPDAPEDPIVATFSTTPDKCTVDWNPPTFDGGRPIDGYQIERSTGGSFQIIEPDTGLPIPTEYEDTTVTGGVSHTYRISAINAEGIGAVSSVSNGCGLPEIPSPPFNAQANNVALNTVAVDWDAPTFDGNAPITGYKIERATEGDPLATNNDWFITNWDREGGLVCTDPATGEIDIEATYIEADANTASNNGCVWNMFKTFDKDDINGRTLTVDHEMIGSISSVFSSVRIYDGAYDLTDFGADDGSIDTKGAGLIQTLLAPTSVAFSRTDAVAVIDTSSAITDDVTIFIQLDDANGTLLHSAKQYRIYDIEITGVRLWDITNTGSPTTDTDIFVSTDQGGSFGSPLETLLQSEEGKAVIDLFTAEAFIVLVADTGLPTTEYIDDTVVTNTQYGYRMSAINSEGTSDPSNVALVTTVGLPPAPDNVSAVATGTSTITVLWSEPDVGDSTILGYKIDRKQGVGGIFATINPFTGDDATTFNDSFLLGGTEYCYQLFTITNIGTSVDPSAEGCATTQDQADPPENLSAVADDGSQITVTWDTPLDNGGSTITGYKIERQKLGDNFITLFEERQPETNRILIDTGLEVGTFYTYRVSAITGFGQGETDTDSATTDATPQAPQNLSCSPAGTTSINLSWDEPQTFSAITGYQIDRKLVGGSFSTIEGDTGNDNTTFLDSGLDVDETYVYRILAHTFLEGDSTFSSETTCSPLRAPELPPANLQGDFSEVVPHQTVLGWDIPDTFGVPITEFRIERDDGAGYTEIGTVSGSTFGFIDQSMDNDVDQKYRVILVGSEGETVPSIAIPFDTNQRSHWHYENTVDDTGAEKNMGTITGEANFNGTGHIGKAFIFNNTRITVDNESDYDFNFNQDFGITSYFEGTKSIGAGFTLQNKTFSFTGASTDGRVFNNGANTIQCASQTSFIKETSGTDLNLRVGDINTASHCIDIFGEWDIGTISNSSNTVTSVELRADVTGEIADTRSCSFVSLELQPSLVGTSAQDIWDDTRNGTDFLSNFGNPICDDPAIANDIVVDLGSLAIADMQSAFDSSQDWWGMGIRFTDQVRIAETNMLLTLGQHDQDDLEIRVNYTTPVFGGTQLFTDEWQIKEQQVLGANDSGCSMTASATDLDVDISFAGLSHCQLFKVFNKADIIGKTIDLTWAGSSNIGINAQFLVLDGAYHRDNPKDFPLNVGSTGFREGINNGLKGGGVLHSVLQGGTSFATTTDSIVATLVGSELPQVTVVVKIRDGSAVNAQHLDVEEIEIVGLDTWTWDSASSVTGIFNSSDFNSAVANANFTGNSIVAGSPTGSQDQVIVSKAEGMTDQGYKLYIDPTGLPSVKLTNTNAINEIFVQSPVNVTDSGLHFIGFGYNGNETASGVALNVDGNTTVNVIADTLSASILNDVPLTIGGTSTGFNLLNGTLDETRFFGSGTLDEDQLDEIENDKLDTTAPINATFSLTGSTFANISGEVPTIILISGFPTPTVSAVDLKNFTTTTVNTIVPTETIDPITGLLQVPTLFNFMGSPSNYTADATLTNIAEAFPLLSNFDLQAPIFTFSGDFFFQQARNPTFDVLSFNYTQTLVPFDLSCNFKSTLFGNGTTVTFTDVFFVQTLQPVDPLQDVVVACIDPNTPPLDPTAPSFGGSNALLSFVSFGDTTGVGNFLNFTENFGEFFGASLPFLFIIILAAAFTGRSAPTGIIIIGVALGIMWAMGILTLDPIMWGVIVVLIILGLLGGKKFL